MRFEFIPFRRAVVVVAPAFLLACGAPIGAPGPDCGIPPLVFDGTGTIQGGTVDSCARAERAPQTPPENTICKACPYDLHRVVVVRGSERFDVTDASRLEYVPSHHNWKDVMRAETGDGRVLQLTFEYLVEGPLDEPDSWAFVLEVLDADGAVVDGPVDLEL